MEEDFLITKKRRSRQYLSWLMNIFLSVVCLWFLTPASLLAGGSTASQSLKAKLEEKLNTQSNIQYEPYYLNADYQGADQPAAYAPQQQMAVYPAEQTIGGQRDENRQNARRSQPLTAPLTSSPMPGPMASHAIYNVKYTAELEENVVTVKGKIFFEVFKKAGWTQLPLVNSSVGLIDVKVNKGSSFVISQAGQYYLIVDKPGRYTLELEYLIKSARERENGPGSFSMDVIPAPIAQFELTMPEKDVQIFVEPAIKVELKAEADKTSAWAVLPNTNLINVRWSRALPKEEIAPVQLDPKLYVETSTHSSIGSGVIRSQSLMNYLILQTEVSSLRVALPEDVSVLEVQGQDLRDWKVSVKEPEGVQYLDVFLNFGVKGNYVLNLTYERNIAEGSGVVQMPWARALGVERENGFYGVSASTNVELATQDLEKVTVIDTKQLPSHLWMSASNPILLAFKYLNHPFNIAIEVTRHEEIPVLIAAIDSGHGLTLHTREGKVLTKITYLVRNNVKQFLRLDLPKEATVWSSFVSGKPVKPARDSQGHVLIPLETSRLQGENLTQFPVEIVYLDKGSLMNWVGQLRLSLPKIDIPINQLIWHVYLPDDYTYFNFDGDVRKVWAGPSQEAAGLAAFNLMKSAQRAVQGRLRSADDDIGDQFAQGMTYSIGGGELQVSKGVLPIKIDIPQQGQFFSFSKLLVVGGESPWLSVRYTAILNKAYKPVKFLIWFIVVLLIVRWIVRRLRRYRKPRESVQ